MDDIRRAVMFSQIRPVSSPAQQAPKTSGRESSIPFDEILEDKKINFTKHAERRLASRQIDLKVEDQQKLEKAMGALSQKGAKDSLVLMGELAFVVNVPQRTVITAMTKDQMNEQVFTNIDSTILV